MTPSLPRMEGITLSVKRTFINADPEVMSNEEPLTFCHRRVKSYPAAAYCLAPSGSSAESPLSGTSVDITAPDDLDSPSAASSLAVLACSGERTQAVIASGEALGPAGGSATIILSGREDEPEFPFEKHSATHGAYADEIPSKAVCSTHEFIVKNTFVHGLDEEESEMQQQLRRAVRTCPYDLGCTEPAPEESPADIPLRELSSPATCPGTPDTARLLSSPTPEPALEPSPDLHSTCRSASSNEDYIRSPVPLSANGNGAFDSLVRWAKFGSSETLEVQSAAASPAHGTFTSHDAWSVSHDAECVSSRWSQLAVCDTPVARTAPPGWPSDKELRLLQEMLDEDNLPPPPPPYAAPTVCGPQPLRLTRVRTQSISSCRMSGDFSEDQPTPISRVLSAPLPQQQCDFSPLHSDLGTPYSTADHEAASVTIGLLRKSAASRCRPACGFLPEARKPQWEADSDRAAALTAPGPAIAASSEAAQSPLQKEREQQEEVILSKPVPWWGIREQKPAASSSSIPVHHENSKQNCKRQRQMRARGWHNAESTTNGECLEKLRPHDTRASTAQAAKVPPPPAPSSAKNNFAGKPALAVAKAPPPAPPQLAARAPAPSPEKPARRNQRGRQQNERLWCNIYINPCMLEEGFDLVKKIIGRDGSDGCNTRKIWDDTNTKVRVRGRGSGHPEVPIGKGSRQLKEAPVPLMMALSADHGRRGDFKRAFEMARDLLENVSKRFQKFSQDRHCSWDQGSDTTWFWVGEAPKASIECLGDALRHVVIETRN